MRNQQHSRLELFLQIGNQIHDLRLNGHVKRGGRLVGQQQLRVTGQRNSDHHALLHAAGKLMRILVIAFGRNSDDFQHFLGALFAIGVAVAMQANHLSDLIADRLHRVERRHRILKNHRDDVAANFTHFVFWKRLKLLPVKRNAPLLHLAAHIRQDAQNGLGDGRLARARLADKPQRAAAIQMQGYAVDCMYRLPIRLIFHNQIVYGQVVFVLVFSHLLLPLSSSASDQAHRASRRPAG